MARKKLSKIQILCIVMLWIALVVLMLVDSPVINFEIIFTAIASGIIILVAISKNT